MQLDSELEEGEISEEQYAECRWSADELAPVGGRIAYPRSGGQMNLLEHVGRLSEIGRGPYRVMSRDLMLY